MNQIPHAPTIDELPTRRQLNRATLIAAGVAAVILVTTVLPAEYGVDPLGTGRLMGLTAMGQSKSDVFPGAGAQEVSFTLAPGTGREVKATMQDGEELIYQWSTADDQPIYWEFHGEETGAFGDDYTSYEIDTSSGENGSFRASFDGTHGWYWKNEGNAAVTITVRAEGGFSKFGLVS